MRRFLFLLPFLVPAPATAQVNPQVDPTVMTGWAGGAAAQQQLKRRYGIRDKRPRARRCSYYARNPALRCKTPVRRRR